MRCRPNYAFAFHSFLNDSHFMSLFPNCGTHDYATQQQRNRYFHSVSRDRTPTDQILISSKVAFQNFTPMAGDDTIVHSFFLRNAVEMSTLHFLSPFLWKAAFFHEENPISARNAFEIRLRFITWYNSYDGGSEVVVRRQKLKDGSPCRKWIRFLR